MKNKGEEVDTSCEEGMSEWYSFEGIAHTPHIMLPLALNMRSTGIPVQWLLQRHTQSNAPCVHKADIIGQSPWPSQMLAKQSENVLVDVSSPLVRTRTTANVNVHFIGDAQ